jgi:predicted O-methyltransferase YrrM
MLKRKIDALLRKFFLHKNEELPSFLLHSLFHQGSYLPFTTSSLKFRLLACLANDVVVNDRRSMLEFGSGISTVLVARLFHLNNIQGKITTIDESAEWQEIIKSILEKEELSHYVNFVHAPTKISPTSEQCNEYNNTIVLEHIRNKMFDLVLVDGPAAWQKETIMSRTSNSKFIIKNVAEKHCIFIDNSDRPGERDLTEKLARELDIKILQLDPTFVALVKGQHFNFII